MNFRYGVGTHLTSNCVTAKRAGLAALDNMGVRFMTVHCRLQSIQIGSGLTTPPSMGTGVAAGRLLPSIAMSGAIPPFRHMLSWRVQGQFYLYFHVIIIEWLRKTTLSSSVIVP